MKNVIIIILAILVLGLGGYLVYEKSIDKDKLSTVKDELTNQETKNNNYEIYVANLSKNINDYYRGCNGDDCIDIRDTWKKLYVNDFVNSSLSFELKTNGDVYAQLDSRFASSTYEKKLLSKYGESYKLASEIIDIYLVSSGNGGEAATLYMIKSDGSLKMLNYYSYSEETDYKIQDNYKSLKNIIHVDERPNMGSPAIFATDINGNVYSLN